MACRKSALTILLLFSILPTMLASDVSSQSFTTIMTMNTQTITGSLSSYITSLATTTGVTTRSVTGTYTQTMFVSTHFTGGCYVAGYAFNVTRQSVHVRYFAGQPFDVYVMSIFDIFAWTVISPANVCQPPIYRYKQAVASSGGIDMNLDPAGNPYTIIAITSGPITNPLLTLEIGPQLAATVTTSTITYATATVTVPYLGAMTQTIFGWRTAEVPFYMQSNSVWIVALMAMIIVIIILVGYMTYQKRLSAKSKRRRRRSRKE